MTVTALDTSVAIPLLLRSHPDHSTVTRWWSGGEVALSGHAACETFSVLTRLSGDARLEPADAATLITTRFSPPLVLDAGTSRGLVGTLADLGVSGGAVYDAMVGLAAARNDAVLATRDRRALSTYERVGARVEIVG